MADEPYGGDDPTAEDCIRAGMYWFSRRDMEAARAWWERAAQLDPLHPKAQECLQLLKTFDQPAHDPWISEGALSPDPIEDAPLDASASYPLPATVAAPADEEALVAPDVPGEKGVWPPPPQTMDAPDPIHVTTDPLEFASQSDSFEPFEMETQGESPWDGPSRTSVVTLDEPVPEFDALAEPTPLPMIDKERFFGRIHDDQALVDYIVATGDLLYRYTPPMTEAETVQPPPSMAAPPEQPPAEIIFDDPIEMTPEVSIEQTPAAILLEAKDKYQLHDFEGVIELVEQVPLEDRTDDANNLLAMSRTNLLKMYESKLGPTDRAPQVRVSSEEIIWLNLNHRAGFILSQIDGSLSYEDIIALSGMDRLDTVKILAELISQRVIISD